MQPTQKPDETPTAESAAAHAPGDDGRAAWERPAIDRLKAKDAETGLLLGPEVLVLLSES